ncbi:MAG TPA: SAM-dependent methyltransferase [Acidimicrobiales bacterium]|jgi:methyltransferase (TIGR00027 family)|nr:SAM-dependent methyltransferase [Acidimicrobiales bacterium]
MRAHRPSLTARWVAARRAALAPTRSSTPTGDLEGEQTLYRDVGGNVTFNFARPSGVNHRTQFIDAEVANAIGRGVEQIVILGAGYDGRALRFGGAPTRWFEVDFPSTQEDKRRRLAALGVSPEGVIYVPIDLLREDLDATLEGAGHDADTPTLFLAEGLVPYLTLEATANMFAAVRARAGPGSVLVATFFVAPEPHDLLLAWYHARNVFFRVIGEPRQSEYQPGDPEKLFVVTGWKVSRSKSGHASRVDRAARMLVLAGEPA